MQTGDGKAMWELTRRVARNIMKDDSDDYSLHMTIMYSMTDSTAGFTGIHNHIQRRCDYVKE